LIAWGEALKPRGAPAFVLCRDTELKLSERGQDEVVIWRHGVELSDDLARAILAIGEQQMMSAILCRRSCSNTSSMSGGLTVIQAKTLCRS